MIDSHIYNPKSQKYYVRKYFEGIKDQLKGRKVIDIPAGNGATTEILLGAGADVEAFDLFPEYFMLKEMECKRADITESIPLPNGYADWVTCQEGIEHFSDQARTFREINRVLKKHGRLLLTTPSYSNLSAKLSYLLFESAYTRALIDLGRRDTLARRDEVLAFLEAGHQQSSASA